MLPLAAGMVNSPAPILTGWLIEAHTSKARSTVLCSQGVGPTLQVMGDWANTPAFIPSRLAQSCLPLGQLPCVSKARLQDLLS